MLVWCLTEGGSGEATQARIIGKCEPPEPFQQPQYLIERIASGLKVVVPHNHIFWPMENDNNGTLNA